MRPIKNQARLLAFARLHGQAAAIREFSSDVLELEDLQDELKTNTKLQEEVAKMMELESYNAVEAATEIQMRAEQKLLAMLDHIQPTDLAKGFLVTQIYTAAQRSIVTQANTSKMQAPPETKAKPVLGKSFLELMQERKVA